MTDEEIDKIATFTAEKLMRLTKIKERAEAKLDLAKNIADSAHRFEVWRRTARVPKSDRN